MPAPEIQAIRDNNIGIALMEQQQFSDALGRFQTACILDPKSDAGCLNTGIALLNMKQYELARNVLAKAAEREPQDPRVWFNLGLFARSTGQSQDALPDFEKVAALDPSDADTQYMIGVTFFESDHGDEAIAAFENALKLDPFQAFAESALAQALERKGDANGAQVHLNRFRELINGNWAHQISSTYGQQGKYSLAEYIEPDSVPGEPAIPVHFVDVSASSGLPVKRATELPKPGGRTPSPVSKTRGVDTEAGRPSSPFDENSSESLAHFLGSGACVLDYDGDGKPDIFLVNADGEGNAALYRNTGHGKFLDATKSAKLMFHGEGTGCATGDYDNDGRPDIAISSNGRVVLYHNAGDGTFKDVTDASGIHTDGLSLGLTFLDYDNDGKLDLYVTRFPDVPLGYSARPFAFSFDASSPGNVLWHNRGDGTFEDRTRDLALGADMASVSALATDVNGDHAVDIVLTGWQKSPTIYLNSRGGAFHTANPWPLDTPGRSAGIVAADFTGNGRMDLALTHWSPPCLSLWKNVEGKSFERVALPELGWMRGWGLATLDYDNDGRPDLVAVGENFAAEGRIVLLRNEGKHGFRDVTHETGLDQITLHNPRGVIAFDYDGNGTTDLLITQNNLPPILLRNVGADKHGWMQLALNGTIDNKGGIGTEVKLFAGAQRQKWQIANASGYLGQGPSEIHAGLSDFSGADVVRLRWPQGLVQNELQVRGEKREIITETKQGTNPPNP